jgi:hypothetical protein
MSDAQPLWSDAQIERTAEALVMTAIQALPQGDTKQITRHIADALTTVRDDLLAESQPAAQHALDFPDGAGWWAWEGCIQYTSGKVTKLEREVVRVFWGTTTSTWQVVRERGRHPAYMLIGKWYQLTMPWEQPASQQPDVPICDKCNDHLAAPSYCDVCYGTLESAYQEAESEVKALKQPAAQPLAAIVAQLRSCGYSCEAGPIQNNVAWRELERLAAQEPTA